MLDRVVELGLDLLGTAGRPLSDLVSVGVGLPGPVEHSTGRPINPPIMPGWDDADVPGAPVPQAARPRARRQRRQRHGPRRAHLAVARRSTTCCSSRSPPASAPGSSPTARSAAAPRAPPATSGTSPSRAGSTCRAAAATPAASRPSPAGPAIASALRRRRDATTSADVVALVRAGDLDASREVREAGRHIGEVLAACVSMLNPSVIVIGGVVAEAGRAPAGRHPRGRLPAVPAPGHAAPAHRRVPHQGPRRRARRVARWPPSTSCPPPPSTP